MKHKLLRHSKAMLVFLLLVAGVSYIIANLNTSNKPRPNFIFILTDDMDLQLMPYMENTNSLLANEGAVFTNFFVTASICCPSRASILRGQYPHNTGILENTPGFKLFRRNGEEAETIAVWLFRERYQTAMLGKYLNLYPTGVKNTYIPEGWTDWHAFLYSDDGGKTDFYFNYMMNENGKLVQYGSQPADYSTDVIKERSIQFINKNLKSDKPFFLYISTYAPHGPNNPAPRHAAKFEGVIYPQNESFGEADITDKPDIARANPQKVGTFDAGDANALFTRRLQSMLAVDEMVRELVNVLDQAGELANTYIIFTSDNGFHMGEHQLQSGKMLPYEEDIRVPFIVRGPGIQPNTQITQMVANIDIAPTIAKLAGAQPADFVDGRSFVSLFNPQKQPALEWRKAFLIEVGYLDTESAIIAFRAVRTETFKCSTA